MLNCNNAGVPRRRLSNGFKLDGAKTFVLNGHVADMVLVAARTGGSAGETAGLTLFAVPRDAVGVSVTTDLMVDSSLASRLSFDGVQVDADAGRG